jgi:2-iminobutanoate/2-iminopropanoate deaminase
MKEIIPTTKAPAPVGPYSPVVGFRDLIFVSGQGPLNPETKELVTGTVQEEARQTLENIKNILEDVGSSLEHVLKVNVYLGDMDDFFRFNEVYAEYFSSDQPARTCIQAGRLPFDIKVEIEVIACKKGEEY